ncbi:phytanoyl-CoA dioxygenase family protein [Caulobacter sp. KR2-114]|uniref:phytanoyl-CoA dioxygenase family protein n=1 Tax=Caulobacter sp. KR2-114 TaxID=3400912 RepID=UPI003C108B81
MSRQPDPIAAPPVALPHVRTPVPTADLQQIRRDVAECGYGVLLNALAPEETARLKDRVLAQAAAEDRTGIGFFFGDDQTGMPSNKGGREAAPNQRLGHLLNKGHVFRRLLSHPLATTVVPDILGRGATLSSLTAMIMRKGGVAQVLHSDQQFVPFPTPVAMVCNVVWMLVDFTAANGATRLVPGTHTLPPPTIRFTRDEAGERRLVRAEAPTVVAEAPAGSALVFDGRLWHGAGANTTDTPRPAIFSYYCQPYLRQQENLPLSLLDEVYAELTEAERALVGFEAPNRAMGRIAPVLGRANTNWLDSAVGELG